MLPFHVGPAKFISQNNFQINKNYQNPFNQSKVGIANNKLKSINPYKCYLIIDTPDLTQIR